MPTWLQIVLGAAALVTAFGVLWTKVVRPTAELITLGGKLLPLLRELTETFKDTPNAFGVLNEIAKQFRTDSGSSLRDLANRLEESAKLNQANIEILKSGLEVLRIAYEATKQVSTLDRDKQQELALAIDRLRIKVEAGTATGLRMEQKAIGIAGDLAVATEKVKGVAQDLADAHKRADETHSTLPAGSAADAAAISSTKEKEEELSRDA